MNTLIDCTVYACFATLLILFADHLHHCWQATAPEQPPAKSTAGDELESAIAAVIPDNTSDEIPTDAWERASMIALADELITACDQAKGNNDLTDLLSIPAGQHPVEIAECTLVPLAKLYGVTGAGKWGMSRKLRQSERERVLQAIA